MAFSLMALRGADAVSSFEDAALGIGLEAPEGFSPPSAKPDLPDVIGEIKWIWAPANAEATAAFAAVHLMPIPDGATFDAFKGAFPGVVEARLGAGYKQVRQEEITTGKLKGFVFEFEAPGNGRLPENGGTIKHHVRWYFYARENGKMTGIIFHSKEDAWKELQPKFDACFKSVKDL
jgi:hypothetical protein